MRVAIARYTAPLMNWFSNLSQREKFLIGGGICAIIPIFAYQLAYLPIKELFTTQSQTLAKLEEDYKTVPFILDRYKRFHAKKSQIEDEFREVEIKEGEQSFLENILSGKVDAGFDIAPGQARTFGGNYEQAPFNVRFSTASLAGLVDVLTEISTGKKRLLITSLNVSRDTNGDKLRVELAVSSIRQLKT